MSRTRAAAAWPFVKALHYAGRTVRGLIDFVEELRARKIDFRSIGRAYPPPSTFDAFSSDASGFRYI
jgi:hypothetical protein